MAIISKKFRIFAAKGCENGRRLSNWSELHCVRLAPSLHRNNEQNDSDMGKLMILLYFILSVFPADATENRRHIHVVRRGSKKSHRGDTVAKIWIEENGQKKIEVAWSELSADEEALIIEAIDKHWDELNRLIDDVFAGKKIHIKRIK